MEPIKQLYGKRYSIEIKLSPYIGRCNGAILIEVINAIVT